MKQSVNISDSLQQIKGVVRKTHYTVLSVILVGLIGMTALTVTGMLNSPLSQLPPPSLTQSAASFEKDPTLEKIDKLEFSSNSSDVSLPKNQRLNPFSE